MEMTVWPVAKGILLLHEMTELHQDCSVVLHRSDQHGGYRLLCGCPCCVETESGIVYGVGKEPLLEGIWSWQKKISHG